MQLRPKGWGWAAIGTYASFTINARSQIVSISPYALAPSPPPPAHARTGPFHDLSLSSPTTLTETQEEACPARVSSLRKKIPEVRVQVKVKLKEGGEDYFQDDITWDITSKHLPEPDA